MIALQFQNQNSPMEIKIELKRNRNNSCEGNITLIKCYVDKVCVLKDETLRMSERVCVCERERERNKERERERERERKGEGICTKEVKMKPNLLSYTLYY